MNRVVIEEATSSAVPTHQESDEPAIGQPFTATATATARCVLSGLSLASGFLLLVADIAGWNALQAISGIVFILLGIGSAPWQLVRRIPLSTRLALSVITSLTVLTLVSTAMLETHQWHPRAWIVCLGIVCSAVHLAALKRSLLDLGLLPWGLSPRPVPHDAASIEARDGRAMTMSARIRAHWSGRPPPAPALLAAGLGFLTCVVAALTHRHMEPDFWGFLLHIGPAWYLGLGLIVFSFFLARVDNQTGMALAVTALLLVLTLTPSLVWDGPREPTSFKHADLVEQIRSLAELKSTIGVYNAWPGFFSGTAWLCDVLGVRDALQLAIFWPPVIGLLRLVVLRDLFGRLLPNAYQSWIAVALALTADSVGQDYFAPQSVGFVLGLGIVSVALWQERTWLRVTIVLTAATGLAVSHQLSPYVIGGVLAVLAVFRVVRPWWMFLLVLGPAALWSLMHLRSLERYVSLAELFRIQNFRPPKTAAVAGLHRQPIVTETVVALVVGILVVGALAFITLVRNRTDSRTWALACCPAIGLLSAAATPYGQEAIFRATLFGLPWLAALAARCFPVPENGRRFHRTDPVAHPRLPHRALLPAVMAVLVSSYAISMFGLAGFRVTRPADAHAVERLVKWRNNFDVLYLGPTDIPVSVRSGAASAYTDLIAPDISPPSYSLKDSPDEQVWKLTDGLLGWTSKGPRPDLYALWSPAQSRHMWAYGLQTPAGFAALRDAFRRSPYWHVVYQEDGTVLFRLDVAKYLASTE